MSTEKIRDICIRLDYAPIASYYCHFRIKINLLNVALKKISKLSTFGRKNYKKLFIVRYNQKLEMNLLILKKKYFMRVKKMIKLK